MTDVSTRKESMNVRTFQFESNVDASGDSSVHVFLSGHPETDELRLQRGDIYFLPEGAKPRPPLPKSDGSQVTIWFPMWQLPIISQMLQNHRGVRCFFEAAPDGTRAGLKDWNTVTVPGASGTDTLSE